MIALLLRYEDRWGSFRTAATIVFAVLVTLSLGVYLLGPGATVVLASLLEAFGWLWLHTKEPAPPNRESLHQRTENFQSTAAGSPLMKNPLIAIGCLILIVLMAGFFVADMHTSCKQEHGPDYKCFPGGRRLVR
jgi:hypothetical protein